MTDLIPIKLVVVGDGYVGKTSLLISYIKEEFRQDYEPTIFDNHSVVVKCGKHKIKLGLWDTAGQQQYGSLRPLAYSNCDIFLIVFSVLDKSSFLNAKNKWYKQLQKCSSGSCKIVVGNKIDLRNPSNPEHITYQRAYKQFTQKMRLPYLECSALSRKGLNEDCIGSSQNTKERYLLPDILIYQSCMIFNAASQQISQFLFDVNIFYKKLNNLILQYNESKLFVIY